VSRHPGASARQGREDVRLPYIRGALGGSHSWWGHRARHFRRILAIAPRRRDGSLEVLRQPAVATERGEEALDDPAPGMNGKADLTGLCGDAEWRRKQRYRRCGHSDSGLGGSSASSSPRNGA
jgi:hypothetical protein